MLRRILPLLLAASPSFAAAPDGKLLFEQNCAACHVPDKMVVGPSLVEIVGIYGKNPEGFVAWAIAPKKKRENVIEMPSMAHVGEPGLRAIHAYVLTAAKGLKEQKDSGLDPFSVPATMLKRPVVQRIFLPNSGPATIAVALPGDLSVAWDAGSCRLRYVWQGGFLRGFPYWKGNGSSQAELDGKVVLKEEAPLFPNASVPKFLGYDMKDGLPVFTYRAGEATVREAVTSVPGGVRRTLLVEPAQALSLTLSPGTTSSVGTVSGSKLTLTAEQSKNFSLTRLVP